MSKNLDLLQKIDQEGQARNGTSPAFLRARHALFNCSGADGPLRSISTTFYYEYG